MSSRRTRAGTAIVEQSSVSTRSKTQKINDINKDAPEFIQRTRQSQRREKSLDIKNSLEATAKQSARKESPDAAVILRKSVKKKSRRRLNLTQDAEAEDKFTIQSPSMDTNESIKILKDRHNKISMTEHIKHDHSQSSTLKDLDSYKTLNKKLQQKIVATGVKNLSIIITPKSTPPKLSLTPHRSKKTPKKSPISLGSPKTHSITVPRLFKSPRKLSLLTTSEENLNKSDNKSHDEKLEKTMKDKLSNYSISHKSPLTPPITKRKHKKSDNLKAIVRKFSKSPKIVLKSPKSKKSKSRKMKLLSPSQKVKKNSLKTSPTNITSDTTPDLDTAKLKSSTKKSSLSKEKNLSRIKHRLMKGLTVSQKEDVLAEPIVLLERLPPEKIQNMLTPANKIRSDTSITIRSPLINLENNFKVFTTSAGSDISVNRNSNTKLKNGNVEKLTNRVSPRIKHYTPVQEKDRLSIPLTSTPQEENISLIDMNLTSNTSIIPIDNTPINTRSRYKNQSNISNVMHKSTAIENISKSLFDNDISDTSQFHTSNVTKRDTTYDKDSLTTLQKEQENKKRNTYELEQPQTISLRQMIKKRTSIDANLSSRENFKRAKVHFADGKFDTSSACNLVNKSVGLQSNILHNVNTQKNNINSAQKSKKVETPNFSRHLLVSSFKARSSPRTNIVTPRAELNGIRTSKSFTLIEKKSEKKSSTKKVPNFGKIHEQMFAKSESVVDAKKRLEIKHLAFTGKKVVPKIDAEKEKKRPLPTDTKDGTHNRFGFKLRKNEATHVILTKQTTYSREKQQQETRMTLKGVRTNRRFELQMKARNLNP
ncbi:titin homolog isoform X1 [Formica exsecta]|uniref:titin homolog isoform X1 n=1 Tax=Formica exsecta TaxID=72781 RepID=UPI001143A6B9|nr:titin homolog isoform X1 [Formica exsecta]